MSTTQPSRIMHVDDDADIREITKLSLESTGNYSVCSCETGERALEQVSSFVPDVILLDVMMPGMSGPAVLKTLQNTPDAKDIPVVFMTAKVQPGEVDALKALGAVDVIAKPFDPISLPETVATIWRHHGNS